MNRFYLPLCALVLLASQARCIAVSDGVLGDLAMHFSPIKKRAGSDLIELLLMGASTELWYHEPKLDSAHRVLGPADNGFILVARTIADVATFKPSQHPEGWNGYPEKDRYPWSAEFHFFSVGRGLWLVVSIWCGHSTDRNLVRELVTAASKSADETWQAMNQ